MSVLIWLRNLLTSRRHTTNSVTFVIKGSISPPTDTSIDGSSYQSLGDAYLAEGNYTKAMECFRRAASVNANHGDAYFGMGMVCLQQNLYIEAEQYFKQAISSNARLAHAHYFLGNALMKQGRLAEAIEHLDKARELKPDAEIVYTDLCFALVQLGKNEEAKKVIQQGIVINPRHADFHFFQGNIHAHDQEFEQAISCYHTTLALQPDHLLAYSNLGKIYHSQGRVVEAIQNYKKALSLQPDLIDAYDNLGRIYMEQGLFDQVIACSQEALKIAPDSPEIHHNLALAYKKQGNYLAAITFYQKALELKPDFAEAYGNLGNVFFEQGNLTNAIACYGKALELRPDDAIACYGMCISLSAKQDSTQAIKYLHRMLQLDPNFGAVKLLLFHQLQHICDWQDWEANVRLARQIVLEAPADARNEFPPFAFLSVPGATAQEQRRCAEKYVQQKFKSLTPRFEFTRQPRDKIHIGYLSGDLRQHAVSFLMAEVFELHDRSRFRISAYSYGANDNSEMRKRLEKAFDRFVDIQHDSHEEAAKKIYSDGIDILVDLAGHTQYSRSEILAMRPAPIQINYLGFPGTMGAHFVDYIIADHFIIPPELQQHYTEKVIWMPDCFQANDRARPRPASPGRRSCELPEDAFVFCCFNQTSKITPEFFDIWCRLLKSVPNSVLWLSAASQQASFNLRHEAERRGISATRLITAPLLPRDEHLARLQCADLFMDTLPFNAGTTCSDALWMGLPVVTCAGDAFASRMAGSLLTALGAPELITYSLDDYFSLALELASDRSKLALIRNKINTNRNTAPLFDSARFTRNLEQAYIQVLHEL